jgi:hypothetical protein
MQLQPRQYQAAHVRTRHPGRTGHIVINADGTNADATGLNFSGPSRESVIADGLRAVQCAIKASHDSHTPVYFHSDSDDLVRYMQSHYGTSATSALLNASDNAVDVNTVNDNATDSVALSVPAANETVATTTANMTTTTTITITTAH